MSKWLTVSIKHNLISNFFKYLKSLVSRGIINKEIALKMDLYLDQEMYPNKILVREEVEPVLNQFCTQYIKRFKRKLHLDVTDAYVDFEKFKQYRLNLKNRDIVKGALVRLNLNNEKYEVLELDLQKGKALIVPYKQNQGMSLKVNIKDLTNIGFNDY